MRGDTPSKGGTRNPTKVENGVYPAVGPVLILQPWRDATKQHQTASTAIKEHTWIPRLPMEGGTWRSRS